MYPGEGGKETRQGKNPAASAAQLNCGLGRFFLMRIYIFRGRFLSETSMLQCPISLKLLIKVAWGSISVHQVHWIGICEHYREFSLVPFEYFFLKNHNVMSDIIYRVLSSYNIKE